MPEVAGGEAAQAVASPLAADGGEQDGPGGQASRPAGAPVGDPLIPMVFHNPWWLDAASGGAWQQVEVTSGGAVVARLPYFVERTRLGQRICTMPHITHSLGPAVDLGASRGANRLLRHVQLTRELLSRLPSFDGFFHKLHGEVSDTFAFSEAGYRTEVQFTFELPPQAVELTWRGMRDKTRNVIRRAAERYTTATLADPELFAAFYEANLKARNLANVMSRMVEVCAAALRHDSGRITVARDGAGAMVAAVFIVWDHRAAYYLLATRSVTADNGAISLLIWQAIQQAHASGLTFDFDGVGTVGSRLLFTGFGGLVTPRYLVTRYTFGYRLGQFLKYGVARWSHQVGAQ